MLGSEEFYPDSVDYLCYKKVENYNTVVVEFLHTNNPYRPAFLSDFQYGTIRTFTDTEITNCGMYLEVSPLGNSLPINTVEWRIRNAGIDLMFEEMQKMYVYFDQQILGAFYLSSGERNGVYSYTIKAESILSMLETETHRGGFYNNANAKDVILNEIFANIDTTVVVDDSAENETITGWLPYGNCRDNLIQICFAIGAIVDTSFDDRVFIYKPDYTATPTVIQDKHIYNQTKKMSVGEVYTGVKAMYHSWSQSDKATDLYKGTLNETVMIVFDEPQYGLTITGGTIDNYGDNWATITGTGDEVVLKGHGYTHNQTEVVRENPYVYYKKKYAESQDATLVNADNVSDVLDRMYTYYVNGQTLNADILLNDLQLTDLVTMSTFDGDKTGMIRALNLSFYGNIKASAEVKCI